MRENLSSKLKQKKGYTLAELLMVIAIIVILLGISIVGITNLVDNLKMAELDEYAKTIYLQAQDQLAIVEVEGALDIYHKEIRDTYPADSIPRNPRFLKEIYALDEYVSDYPIADPMADKLWEHMCYLTRDDEDSLTTRMISQTSDIYLNGGSYLIEFNPKTGDVYGVFYWESGTEISYENDVMTLTSRERGDRKSKKIGYYGGALASDLEETDDLLQKATLINGEELYLKFSFKNTAELAASYATNLKISVAITGEHDNTVTFDAIDLSNVDLSLETIDFYMLLDSMYEGHRFNDIVNDGKSEAEQIITPGENLTIKVTAAFTDSSGNTTRNVKTVQGNSLFANDTNNEQIGISALRHMLNLNREFYNGAAFADRNTVQYISNVDFNEEAYSWEINSFNKAIHKEYGTARRPMDYITPIENDSLFILAGSGNRKVTGKNANLKYVLRNFIVEPVVESGTPKDNVGIFGEITNTDFSNIYVENVTVNAENSDNVGGLIGYLKDGSITECGVYLATSGEVAGTLADYSTKDDSNSSCHTDEMAHRYDTYRIKGKNNVGGLVGKAEATAASGSAVKIEKAFAAIKTEGADSYAGGLIGYACIPSGAGTLSMEHSYASGDVIGQEYVGGFAGGVVSEGSNKVIVTDNYATGNIYGNLKYGGFLGKTQKADYKECISYGKLLKLGVAENEEYELKEEDKAGGFVYDGTDTSLNSSYNACVYLTQAGYNKGKAIKDPAAVSVKNYADLMSETEDTAVTITYPYSAELYMERFPFEKLEEQRTHYGNWAKRFFIDTSLVYYEKYADGSYGYYCVTAVSSANVLLLDTLKNESCVEDGYGLLTKYNLEKISYDLYIGNQGKDGVPGVPGLSGENVPVVSSEDVEEYYDDQKFVCLNQQEHLLFEEIESYNAETGEVGAKTSETLEVDGLYLYPLPYDLQCTDRKGVSYFYDRIVFNGFAKGGTNQQVIKDMAYLYCPHFAKTAFNPNISGEEIDLEETNPVVSPKNVFVRSARQLNALGRFSYYWNTNYGLQDKVTYIQETDINFSTYVKTYAGQEFDLQAFGKPYSNRAIGGQGGAAFQNTYDGYGNLIIDYCVDGGIGTKYTGLFGEINGAHLKNITMAVSSEPKGKGGIITSSYRNQGVNRAGVGALVGLAYKTSNIIENCAVSGYIVQYELKGDGNDPLGVAVGGLAGFSMSPISNCTATNDVKMILYKHYTETIAKDSGGIAYLGGFAGSQMDRPVENCYSGGTIDVLNETGEDKCKIPYLRVGGFCPGWLDTTDSNRDNHQVGYTNVYSYTKVSDRIWDVDSTISEIYVPLVSTLMEWYPHGSAAGYEWNSKETTISFVDNIYVEEVTAAHLEKASADAKVYYMKDGVDFTAEQMTLDVLADNATVKVTVTEDTTNTYIKGTVDANGKWSLTPETEAYPYQAVIRNVDENGTTLNEYAHYGEWPKPFLPETILTYYEEYADGSYGYYSVVDDPNNDNEWLLNSLKDATCVEDGYGLLTNQSMSTVTYAVNDGNGISGTKDIPESVEVKNSLVFRAYEDYDAILGEPGDSVKESTGAGSLYTYLNKLPYELHDDIWGSSTQKFYNKITLNDTVTCYYNPHFAKAAINPKESNANNAWNNPTKVYVRSARQLNALCRNPYYWEERGLTFIQETDINFSTYVKTYAGQAFDLQAFGEAYSNHPIGEHDNPFSNIYDGRSNRIIDYCVDGGCDPVRIAPNSTSNTEAYKGANDGAGATQYTGLFGEIANATLKNIVMVVSSAPKGNGGLITSSYRTRHIPMNKDTYGDLVITRENRAGVGALLGMANSDSGVNTIENCVASGYTVKYLLKEGVFNPIEEITLTSRKAQKLDYIMEPLGVAIGGLIGYSTNDISNCAAVNHVVIELEKDYRHTYDNYYNRMTYQNEAGSGGVVYMGGFVGSYFFGKVENCYSGGTITALDNEHWLPQLRVGNFCPGWMDISMNVPEEQTNNLDYKYYLDNDGRGERTDRTFEYKNVYSYTTVSDSVWDVHTTSTHYVPLVSRMVDYFDRGEYWSNNYLKDENGEDKKIDGIYSVGDEYWLHNQTIKGSDITFTDTFYLQDLSEDQYLMQLLNDASELPENFYMADDGENTLAAEPISYNELKARAEETGKEAARTYLDGDMVSSAVAYPYPEVIRDVDENGNLTNTYVHYGDWYDGADKANLIKNYPVYYEEYEDGYGFHYVKEDGTIENSITQDPTKEIQSTGYGFLTIVPQKLNTDMTEMNFGIDDTTYYLQMLSQEKWQEVLSGSSSLFPDRYQFFEMERYSGENSVQVCMNPKFGAALDAGELGTETTPLQIRTKEQFYNIGEGSAKYYKQTHDINLAGGHTPLNLEAGSHYDGSYDEAADEGCVIKNAADTIFMVNNGTIHNTKVVSFDSTNSAKDTIASFVIENNGEIADCSVGTIGSEENIVMQGTKAYGFVATNNNKIRDCYAVVSNVTGTEEAAGFVGMNAGTITDSAVYLVNNETDAVIHGKIASGFAATNYWGYKIENCFVQGTESGITNGLAKTNNYSINFGAITGDGTTICRQLSLNYTCRNYASAKAVLRKIDNGQYPCSFGNINLSNEGATVSMYITYYEYGALE